MHSIFLLKVLKVIKKVLNKFLIDLKLNNTLVLIRIFKFTLEQKEIDSDLLKNLNHFVILDSSVLDLNLAGLANLNTIYIRNSHLLKIDVRNLVNLKKFVLKDLKLKEMDAVQSLSTSLTSLTLENTEILFIDKSYFTGRHFLIKFKNHTLTHLVFKDYKIIVNK